MQRSQWLDITVGFPMAEVKQTPQIPVPFLAA